MEEIKFDFLKLYIEKALDDAGFDKLTEETRAQYIPEFVDEAKRRIGLALLPLLEDDAADDLEKLLINEQITTQEVQQFWSSHVPNFNEVVQKTLVDFAQEMKDTLARVS